MTKRQTTYDINDSKLPALSDLRTMAGRAGLPKANTDAVIPPKTKPTKEAKRQLMQLIADRLADDPDLAATLDFEIAGTPPNEPSSPADPPYLAGSVSRRRLDNLHPNAVNGRVFSTSLSGSGVKLLAEDIERNGQRHPIEIRPDGTIIDGERRWRALKQLGWEYADVIVQPGVTDDDLPGCILDAYSSMRDATTEERVNLFQVALEVLRQRHGRPVGRPAKSGSNDPDFWPREKVAGEAARRAGLSSPTLAKRAVRVFAEAGDAVKAAVNSGELTISAAYANLVEAQKAAAAQADTDSDAAIADQTGDPAVEPAAAVGVATAGSEVSHGGDPVEAAAAAGNSTPGDTGNGLDGVGSASGCAESARPDEPADAEPADQEPVQADPAEADSGDDESTDADPCDADAEMDLEATWATVLGAVDDRETATKMASELLEGFDADYWICDPDQEVALDDLARVAERTLNRLAADDVDAAAAWLEATATNLGVIICDHRPYED